MKSSEKNKENILTASLFVIIPTFMLIVGYYFFAYPISDNVLSYLQIPMFLGLFLLIIGYFIKQIPTGNYIKISGWLIFAFYWSTQPMTLYIGEGNDFFNGAVCVIGVYVLCYIAYHEWLSVKRGENISCLNWIAGASGLAGIIYFGIEKTFIADWLIDRVTEQSAYVTDFFVNSIYIEPGTSNIFIDGEYAVSIIFACTAVQSIVIFVGMIGVLPKIDMKRRAIGLAITIIPVYILNLFRNAMVGILVGKEITSFSMAHNIIAKSGSLIALIILLVIVIKIIPEVFDEIFCFVDLHKRNGPIEKIFRRKK